MTGVISGHVLVVEDDYAIREAICDFLRDEGYEVEVAENGSVALLYLESARTLPSVILLDISMPVMDGYAFREAQIKNPKFAAIPTAMISADGHVKDKAAKSGLVEFLKKPVDLGDLLGLVGKYCRQ